MSNIKKLNIEEKPKKLKKLNIGEQPKGPEKETIFIESDGYVYEVKLTFNQMDIVNAIEEYIDMINIYTFEVKSEETIAKDGMLKKFFPYVGKFRLEGNLKATNNYFVPIYSELLNVLFLAYKDDTLIEKSLSYIDKLYTISEGRSDDILGFINRFLEKMEIEILKEYSVEELSYSLDCLIKIESIEISKTYSSLKQLLEASNKNNERINRLGLNDKFIDAIKAKQKDEECDAIVAKANEPYYKIYNKHI